MEKTLFDEIERVGPEGAQQMIRQTVNPTFFLQSALI